MARTALLIFIFSISLLGARRRKALWFSVVAGTADC
jgi:hypothetical protein